MPWQAARIALAGCLIIIALLTLFFVTFITAFAIDDCGPEFVGADDCEDVISLSDAMILIVVPTTVAAAPASCAGMLLRRRWWHSVIGAWSAALVVLLASAGVFLLLVG
jgi:hypothetical protein